MGAGIAVEFRERFGHVAYLKSLKRQPGQVATLPICDSTGEINKYIFNVVTKPRSANCLPREEEFRPAVKELASLCASLGVQTLAMPQIGAGLDRQPWRWAKNIIEEAFAGSDTDVLIFLHPSEYPKNECRRPPRNRRTFSQVVANQSGNARVAASSQQQTVHASKSDFPDLKDPKQPKTKNTPKTSPTERFVSDLTKASETDLPKTPEQPTAASQSKNPTPYGTPESPTPSEEDTSVFRNRLEKVLGRPIVPLQDSGKNFPVKASSNGK